MSRSLSPCPAEVQVERLLAKADHIILMLRAVRRTAACPGCAQLSSRIHSYYERRLDDLPWNGIPVRICLRTRRFFGSTEECAHHIFTERLPETTATCESTARRKVLTSSPSKILPTQRRTVASPESSILTINIAEFLHFLQLYNRASAGSVMCAGCRHPRARRGSGLKISS
jgi:zinc-finger of transposase IS204/IS1001/IS1096/IS1165